MIINGFSSYFGLLASFCIVYVGFSYFRNEINKTFFKLSQKDNALTVLLNEIKAFYVEETDKELREGLDELTKRIEFDISKILFQEKAARAFVEIFKHISLICFFYCLVAIILGGFQSSLFHDSICCFYAIGVFGIFCLGHNLYIFIISYKVKKLRLIVYQLWLKCAIYLLLSIVIVHYREYMYNLQPLFSRSGLKYIFIFIIIFTPISLFFSLFTRVSHHLYYYKKEIATAKKGYQKILNDLKNGAIARNVILKK